MVSAVFGDDGKIKPEVDQDQLLKITSNMLKEFDRNILPAERAKQRDEYDFVDRATMAIANLKRAGKNPTLRDIAKLVRKNRWTTRNLMVKYGMFDPKTQKIINRYGSVNLDEFKY